MSLQIFCLSVVITTIVATQGYGFILEALDENVNTISRPNNVKKPHRSYVNPSNPLSMKNAWVLVQLEQNNSKPVRVGDRVEFNCEITGSPTPSLHWIRGIKTETKIKEILKKGIADVPWEGITRVAGKLVIDCVTPEDEGLIYCAGVAGREIQLASTFLRVDQSLKRTCQESNKPVINLNAKSILSNIGSTIIIPCRTSGNPRPEIYWLDNFEKRINFDNSRYSILENGDLLVEDIKWEDMGRYVCVAKSGDVEVSADTFLYPLKPELD
ncbi:neural/ectodermal development factor IMP-L2 isoform X2 [Leptopilina heterotoma]|nr:neural/ectodermal development factor IMP-L2 isoform X2 [Leptopilina heterotoma]